MKVLMLGWEFPPFKTGGLGTACYGLTRGLKNMGVEVIFVAPMSCGAEASKHVKFIGAPDVHPDSEKIWDVAHVSPEMGVHIESAEAEEHHHVDLVEDVGVGLKGQEAVGHAFGNQQGSPVISGQVGSRPA